MTGVTIRSPAQIQHIVSDITKSSNPVDLILAQHCKVVHWTHNMTHAEFSRVRQHVQGQGLGGSDAAAAVGVSRWESPFAAWYRIAHDHPKDVTEQMNAGVRLQPVIAEMTAEKENLLSWWDPHAIFRSLDLEWAIATPDYVCLDKHGEPAIVEIKNSTLRLEKEWRDDAVPESVQCQALHNMRVTGLRRCLVGALIDGWDLRTSWIDYDEKAADGLVTIEERFWNLVVNKEEPPVDGHKSTTNALISRYGEVSDDVVELSIMEDRGIDAGLWCADVNRLNRVAADVKVQITHQKNRLRAVMGEAQVLKIDGVTRATWNADKNGKRALRVMDLDDDDSEGF